MPRPLSPLQWRFLDSLRSLGMTHHKEPEWSMRSVVWPSNYTTGGQNVTYPRTYTTAYQQNDPKVGIDLFSNLWYYSSMNRM